ncbi:hypothetical protein GALMADRAFT_144395 [Galerina marginata CBS 339.88]|uniref:MCM AAA-lid domain-containing protein n=1 Tax=Galerina marginata (strain CBS 339.88) TaxID=685588 RepID=A0A067STC9_GALM3|nr:hypothetical protein GALMADRAFT_144395 [Galerina marginata CBS 339.88]
MAQDLTRLQAEALHLWPFRLLPRRKHLKGASRCPPIVLRTLILSTFLHDTLDRKLAQHLVGLYLEDAPAAEVVDFLPVQELSAYIDYARSKSTQSSLKRQRKAHYRLSEAHARMRFSDFVELGDVKEASRLMREAIRTSAMDPRTGKIDMGLLNTGMGTGQRKMRGGMRKEILNPRRGDIHSSLSITPTNCLSVSSCTPCPNVNAPVA